MDLFRLRCYMAQRPGDDEQALLRPHAAFVVDKAKSSRGKKSPRLLLFNLLEQAGTGPPATPARHPGHARAAALRMRSPFRAQRMFNYKKDTLQNEFDLSDIDHIEEASEGGTSRGDHKLEVTIHFKQTHPYYLRAQSLDQYHTLVQVLRHVVRASQTGNISARARAPRAPPG